MGVEKLESRTTKEKQQQARRRVCLMRKGRVRYVFTVQTL
jgi:hypothetical protein